MIGWSYLPLAVDLAIGMCRIVPTSVPAVYDLVPVTARPVA